ncbi:MAG: circadian clock protein KaiC [Spirochaetales bacterium]|nr:circadian clock protein KaiC [Spirochaetales bacterium]
MEQTELAGISKAPLGVEGFDTITRGGLPRGRITLLVGTSGSGKTILGLEFLARGARQFGEPGVLLSFEESEQELVENFVSLGFDLPGLIGERLLVIDHIALTPGLEREAGSYDLEGLLVRLEQAIDSIGARRVVLDAVPALFQGFSDSAAVRIALARLFERLKGRGITTLVSAESESELMRQGLGRSLSDCIIHLSIRVRDRLTTRYLRVAKYRGAGHHLDEFPFLITDGGLSVLPVTSVVQSYGASAERITTGIPALDAMLDGGFYRGSSILVSGEAGTGKSSLAVHVAAAACERGERCLYYLFEESEEEVLRNMRSIGFELTEWLQRGLLSFAASRASAFGLEMHLVRIENAVREFEPRVAVFDPISNLVGAGAICEVKSMTSRLLDYLKSRGITSLFTLLREGEAGGLGGEFSRSEVGVSSLMDAWITLSNRESDGEQTRLIGIRKARGIAHSNQVREFVISDRGVDLVEVVVGPTGILTGTARAAFQSRQAAEAARRERLGEARRRALELERARLRAQIATLEAELSKAEQDLEEDLAATAAEDEARLAEADAVSRSRGAAAEEAE